MSMLKKIGIGLIAVLLALLVALTLLVTTTPGLHFMLNSATRWVPGLAIGKVDGGWRDLTLQDFSYQMPGVTVKATRLHLALTPSCLWHSKLCINDLSLQGLDVVVDTKAMPPASQETTTASEPTTEISTPLTLDLQHFSLQNTRVTVDDIALSLAEFQTGMFWQGRSLTLQPTRIASLLVALPKTPVGLVVKDDVTAGDVAQTLPQVAKASQDKDVKDAAKEKAPAEPPLGERLQAMFAKPLLNDMPAITLPLDVTITDITGEQLRVTGDQDVTVNRLQLQASTLKQAVTLQRFSVQSPQGSLFANGAATLNGDWPVTFNANGALNIDPLKGERLKLTIDGALRQQLKLAMNLSGPQRAQLNIDTALAEQGLPLTLKLQSSQLRWPMTGTAQYQMNNLQVNFGGKATDYALNVKGDIRGSAVPPASLRVEGKGDLQQFELAHLRLDAFEGYSDITAKVDWRDAINWSSALTISGINTGRQWADWPLRLNGIIKANGKVVSGSDWQVQVPQLQMDGSIRRNKLTAKGSLSGNAAGLWNVPGLNLALGRNQINVKGKLDDRWQLLADINAPELNGMLPGLGGHILGNLHLDGRRDAPQVRADLTASSLRWQDLRIQRIDLKSDVRTDQQIQGTLALKVAQLTQGSLKVSSVDLEAGGNETKHQLQLTVKGEPVSGQLALNGSFDRAQERWRGTLNHTRFDTPVGEWRLTQAMSLDYLAAAQKITVGTHCWVNPHAEVCVPKPIEAGPSGHASVRLNRFDLAMLEPFLSEDTVLTGRFSGDADVSWQASGGLPQAKVTLNGDGVSVRQQMQGGALPVVFDTLTLNAGLDRGQAKIGWRMAIRGNGRLNGDVLISDPQQRRNLSGTVTIDTLSLDMLNPALQQGEKAAGILNANLRLGGNVERPQLFGQMVLEKLDIDGNWMPVDLKNGRLAVYFNGMSSTLQGFLKTTQGQVNLAGGADWSQPDAWRARVAVKGDRMRVTVPPMVRLDVSPDIVFEATPQLLALNGSVNIPWARIVVHDLPASSVGVSSDEVMLNEEGKPTQEKSTSIPINSNLTIHIGDDVKLDAYGLTANLAGDLKVAQDERGLGLNGQINIPSGRFKAYGQDLQVRKGQLLFAGPPGQPMLNIEAIRNPDNTEDDVTVGIRVTGSASAPKLEVFSDPTMSQQEALSYLLRGQGLDSSGTDSSMMTSALIGLGVAQTGQVVGKIGEAFGVSNLALDTQGAGDNSQVVVSGYVAPGLQVKYGVGIFDSLATLTLRYRLMPKLYLEAVSGVSQALDVLYQFEF
ncbi:translocation/assembly module TamB domain-containing protein [Lonsdalea quercina]|uniref:autotransporter assembly complex protein TamB n=1 Tax=Lonsdalea quercina TaxID=71657 RepID=UPI003974DC45